MSFQRYLVTSALPYANGPIHMGHVAGAYLPADIYVRYLRKKGRDVVFIGGTDEYGTAITETARKCGQTPIQVADHFHQVIADGLKGIGISFDNFSRTTREIHTRDTQEFFLNLYNKGLLETHTTEQLYDPEIGKFLADRQIRGTCNFCGAEDCAGDQCEKCGKAIDPLELINPRSALSGATLERRETTHYYFPFSKFQPWLEEYINSREGWRPQVIGFCKGYFQEGLRDRPITRDIDWGIPVPLPDHEGKVLYVWFDAPIGYISSTKEWAEKIGQPEKWKEYWCDTEGTKLVNFIGKDNTIFHALLFPAWCHAHGGLVVATDVPSNEFLNLEGQKFSTSRNHAIWLHEVLERWPADYLRYYLTTIMPETADGDWKWSEFRERINGELNDNLGNFVQRTLKFISQYAGSKVPQPGELTDADHELLAAIKATPKAVGDALEGYEFKRALRDLLELTGKANGYFQAQQPWKLRKEDPARCDTVLYVGAQVCAAVAVCLAPFLPDTAANLAAQLNLLETSWDAAGDAALPAGHPLTESPAVLFTKVTEKQIAAETALLNPEPAPEPAPAAAPKAEPQAESAAPAGDAEAKPAEPEYITIDQFLQTHLVTATVKEAERVPKADKLLKLQLDVAGQPRQILAGIAQHYTPEELIGQTIILVANLQPRKLRGQTSEGMLLAATEDDSVVILTTLRPVKSGCPIH